MKPRSGRTIGLYTKVSPEEKAVIEQKMEQAGTDNLRAYLRKMAVDGYVIRLDMTDIREAVLLLRSVSNNVNQIAKRCNETRNFYADDLEDLQSGYARLWQELRTLLDKFDGL